MHIRVEILHATCPFSLEHHVTCHVIELINVGIAESVAPRQSKPGRCELLILQEKRRSILTL